MKQLRTLREIDAPVHKLEVNSYRVPTTQTEADGTLEWNSTTLILVEIVAENKSGIGFTYASRATASIIAETLTPVVIGKSALDIPEIWQAMIRSVRNLGRPGAASMAISAVDIALWDLKAKLLDLPLVHLLGMCREAVPIYGSFSSLCSFYPYSVGM